MTQTHVIAKTLKKQRDVFEMEPIHKKLEPVRAYAKHIAQLKGEPFSVVKIPQGSAAYKMGYRYVSIPAEEVAYYVENGAEVV